MSKSKNNTLVERVLQKIKNAYDIKTDASLARFLGMRPNTLAMQKKRNSLDWFRIFKVCNDLDKNWLLHDNPSSNGISSPIRFRFINQSKLTSHNSTSKPHPEANEILMPPHLFPEDILQGYDPDNCILVKIDRTTRTSEVNIGDVVLVYTDIDGPHNDEFHLIDYEGTTQVTHIAYKSSYRLILKDQDRNDSTDPVAIDSKDVTLIGRVLWIGGYPSTS